MYAETNGQRVESIGQAEGISDYVLIDKYR